MTKKDNFFKTATMTLLLTGGALFGLNAQVTIGADKSPESFSVLELISNQTKGLRLPQMDSTYRNQMVATQEFQNKKNSEAEGLTIFNTDTKCVETWNGTVWIQQCGLTQPTPSGIEICNGTACTFILPVATGSTGAITYLWEESTDGINWTPAAGTNNQPDYTTPALTANRYYRRKATSGSQSTTSAAALVTVTYPAAPEFMGYNLGADTVLLQATYPTLSPAKQQMSYLRDDATAGNPFNPFDATVYGGWYQWGRKADGHELPRAVGTANTTNISATDCSNVGHSLFIRNQMYWCSGGGLDLWGNGASINTITSGGGVYYNGNYYQQPVKSSNDPCPNGWRIPTQDEWERLVNYDCNPTLSVFNFTGERNTTGELSATGYRWIFMVCDNSGCYPTTTTIVGARMGCAIYRESDLAGKPAITAATNLITHPAEPFLFLPSGGNRDYLGGNNSVGTGGAYWSSSTGGYYLYCFPSEIKISTVVLATGMSVRCVK
jgi:uncharacterized protein (TIGR02145 family)